MELAPEPPPPADGSYDKGADMPTLLLVALAGAAGAAARYGVLDRGHVGLASAYSLGSLVAGLTAVTLGVYVGRALL
jgi:fluoride ion exporter CrcB/FEX